MKKLYFGLVSSEEIGLENVKLVEGMKVIEYLKDMYGVYGVYVMVGEEWKLLGECVKSDEKEMFVYDMGVEVSDDWDREF